MKFCKNNEILYWMEKEERDKQKNLKKYYNKIMKQKIYATIVFSYNRIVQCIFYLRWKLINYLMSLKTKKTENKYLKNQTNEWKCNIIIMSAPTHKTNK